MKALTTEIEKTVLQHAQVLSRLSDPEFGFRRAPGKWSRKEILGHLIDSAQNNIQRFVRGQYEDTPRIVYAQDDWVRLQDYHGYSKDDLLQFWVLINKHLCRILLTMDPANYEKQCNKGTTAPEIHSLLWLAEDYLVHMRHHLSQMEIK